MRGLSDEEVREVTMHYEDTKLVLKVQPKGSMTPKDCLVYFHKGQDHGHTDAFEDPGAFLWNGLVNMEQTLQRELVGMAGLTDDAAEEGRPRDSALTREPRNGDATRSMMGSREAPHTPSEPRTGHWSRASESRDESHWPRASESGNARIAASKPLPARDLRPNRDSSSERRKGEYRVSEGAITGVGCKLMHLSDGTISLHEVKIGGGAHQAGVPSGARLLAVDGKDVHDMPIEQIRELCKGPEGSVTYLKLVPPEALKDTDVDDHDDATLRCETFEVRRIAMFRKDENASSSLKDANSSPSSMQRKALRAKDSDTGVLHAVTAKASVTRCSVCGHLTVLPPSSAGLSVRVAGTLLSLSLFSLQRV